jgi:hypothetical protein
VLELDEDGVHCVENWLEALEEHRTIGQEQEAADEQQRRHLAQSIAYREHLNGKNPPDEAPTEEEMAEVREVRQQNPRRKIDTLEAQGMRSDIATREVLGADGFLGDLSPVEDDQPPGPPEEHPLDCECLGCSATMPTYARPALRGAAEEGA